MSLKRCSGAGAFAQPKIELVPCPDCGADVEIWSDESTGTCPDCSRTVIRSITQSCVDWCAHAKECLGDQKYQQYGEMKAEMRKSALIEAVVADAGGDVTLVEHTRRVMAFAESLLSSIKDGDPSVVMTAAALQGLARTKTRELDAAQAEADSLDGVLSILDALGYSRAVKNEVRGLLSAGDEATLQDDLHFKILHDAVLLAGPEESSGPLKRSAWAGGATEALLTEAARDIAGRRG